jgi:hypothetical protein
MRQNVNQSSSKKIKISYGRVELLAKEKKKKNGQEENPKWINLQPQIMTTYVVF